MRDLFLRGCVALGVATALITELLSPFHLLRRGPVLAAWLATVALAAVWLSRHSERLRWRKPAIKPLETALTAVVAIIAVILAVTALLSPPNSADALAYHMPRVIYWAQAGSVAFYPTSYLNQISLQPLAEYFDLHSFLLTGGDRLINLITCAAFLAAVAGVSAIAAEFGLGTKGQAFAAFFCATLPNGILQASGAKNDCMAALWLVCAVYFAARRDAPFTGLALGLALATKATAYLFAPPVLLAVLLMRRPPFRWRAAAWIAACALAINLPQFVRNAQFSGSPLGYDSAQGDGMYRWHNDRFGVKTTVSNLIRHTSEQFGGRDPGWNQAVFDGAIRLHKLLGIDPQDPATTWFDGRYVPPRNANHEANGNNRWSLVLLAVAAIFAAAARRWRWVLYTAGLFAAFLLFCFYLKWQPYMIRLELPLFALAAPLAGMFLEALRPPLLAILICVFLATGVRLPLLQNWTRPLQGPHSLFVTARDDNYFNDMAQWDFGASFRPAIDLAVRSGCTRMGIDASRLQLEYPFQALVRERNPAVRFFHTGVENQSARYTPANQPAPCLVFCPDCAGDPRKVALYSGVGPMETFGRFLVFHAILPAK